MRHSRLALTNVKYKWGDEIAHIVIHVVFTGLFGLMNVALHFHVFVKYR